MKILSLILFIIIYELSLENPLDDLRHKAYDDAYYSERIKKILRKSGLDKKKLIEKYEYKNVFITTIDQSLRGLNFYLNKKNEKEKYMNNLLGQIFYKLVEKEKDDIEINEAIKIYEPNKILNAADEVMKKLGYGDLVEKITNEVINEDNNKDNEKDNKLKKNKKILKNKKHSDNINTDL